MPDQIKTATGAIRRDIVKFRLREIRCHSTDMTRFLQLLLVKYDQNLIRQMIEEEKKNLKAIQSVYTDVIG